MKIVATNKKAFHDYFIEETLECGIALAGCEVKSVRQGQVNMTDSFCRVKNGELVLCGCHIKSYDKGSYANGDSRRERKLLAHKREIMRLLGKVNEKGFAIVPTKFYFVDSLVKVEVALVRGKKNYDKRATLMQKDVKRATERAVKDYTERK